MTSDEIDIEVNRFRATLRRLKERSDAIDRDVADARHRQASLNGSILALLDELDQFDEIRKAQPGGGSEGP